MFNNGLCWGFSPFSLRVSLLLVKSAPKIIVLNSRSSYCFYCKTNFDNASLQKLKCTIINFVLNHRTQMFVIVLLWRFHLSFLLLFGYLHFQYHKAQ